MNKYIITYPDGFILFVYTRKEDRKSALMAEGTKFGISTGPLDFISRNDAAHILKAARSIDTFSIMKEVTS